MFFMYLYNISNGNIGSHTLCIYSLKSQRCTVARESTISKKYETMY
jgi:hypothetical protein